MSLHAVYPELLLLAGAMVGLMWGVFSKGNAYRSVRNGALAVLVAAAVLALLGPKEATAMGGMLRIDLFGLFVKIVILAGASLAVMVADDYLAFRAIDRFEYPVLVLLATAGMMLMVSSANLLALYVGLELQSLALYVLAAFNRERVRSSEAGLKYFVLGALSSGVLLYGITLLYGFVGSIDFATIAARLTGAQPLSLGALTGLVFVLAGLAFKIAAVPFHMWTPDVYEGAPTPVVALFAGAPKAAAFALLVRVLIDAFPAAAGEWRQIVILLAVASMALGSFAALVQTNIKRLMAYSSIAHMGFALTGLVAGTADGVKGVLVYLAIYVLMSVGAFALILAMREEDGWTEEIADLAGLAETRPGMAAAMAIFMFSMAGIPLLAGFFAKLYVFMAVVEAGFAWLAVVGFVLSVVSAVYYLRIVKIMYMDPPRVAFQAPGRGIPFVASVTAALNSPLHLLLIWPLVLAASLAAQSLFS